MVEHDYVWWQICMNKYGLGVERAWYEIERGMRMAENGMSVVWR